MIHDHPEPIGAWRAKSSRYAKVKTAILAVHELEGIAPFKFRSKYGCDCHLRRGESLEGKSGAEASVMTESIEQITL